MTSSPISDPHHLHDRFLQVVATRDVQGMVDRYEPTGTAVLLEGGTAVGDSAIRAMAEGLVDGIRSIRGGTRRVHVAGDIALTSGTWTAEIELPDGSLVSQEGVTAEVARRQPDGSWRFVIDDPRFV